MALVALALTAPAAARAKRPIEPLVSVLEEADDYKQRLAAVIGLGRIGDKRAVPALVDALEDEHPTVCGAAASVLGQLGDRRAISALATLVKRTKHRYVREQAKRTLEALRAIPVAPPPTPAPPTPGGKGPVEMKVKGTLGTLDRAEVQAGIAAQMPQAKACFARRFAAAPYLGGKILLRVRVATDGTTRWLRIERGDLGSLETERCITAALGAAVFAKPRGGEAEFTIPLRFGGGEPVLALEGTSPIAALLAKSCKALLEGTEEPRPKALQVSLYIDHRGQVTDAGLASADEIAATFADRFVANLKGLTLTRRQPASGYAKLVYRFACGGS